MAIVLGRRLITRRDGRTGHLRGANSAAYTPKELTHSLPLSRPLGLPIYVARLPSAPFASRAFNIRCRDSLKC